MRLRSSTFGLLARLISPSTAASSAGTCNFLAFEHVPPQPSSGSLHAASPQNGSLAITPHSIAALHSASSRSFVDSLFGFRSPSLPARHIRSRWAGGRSAPLPAEVDSQTQAGLFRFGVIATSSKQRWLSQFSHSTQTTLQQKTSLRILLCASRRPHQRRRVRLLELVRNQLRDEATIQDWALPNKRERTLSNVIEKVEEGRCGVR